MQRSCIKQCAQYEMRVLTQSERRAQLWNHPERAWKSLIETLYRENDSFRDRDLIRVTQFRIASKFSDAELLHNIRVSI